jgi:signal transduction histidine kinase
MAGRSATGAQAARAGAAVAVAALAVASESAAYLPDAPFDAAADALAGLAWAAAGLVVWARRPRVAALMFAVGVAWLLGDLEGSLVFLHRGPLVQVLLAYPAGRLRGNAERLVVAAAYVDGAVSAVGGDPTATLVFSAVVAAAAVAHRAGATGIARRSYAVPAIAAVVLFGILAAGALLRLAEIDAAREALLAYEAGLALAAAALAADLQSSRWTTGTVTELVVELGGPSDGASLRDALREAAGDPTLVVAYPLADATGYVDELGSPVEVPAPGPERGVTAIEDDHRVVAMVVHDPRALGDRQLLTSVSSSLRLALANARLDADLRAQGEQVAASRRRLLDAAAAQRRDVAARLRNTVDRELVAAERMLSRDAFPDVADRLAWVRDQLERHAAGLGPPGLAEGGLRAALAQLAGDGGLVTDVACPAERFAPALELAAWYVCSESLANALKHARATGVRIAVAVAGDDLRVEVRDDGRGGADPHGSGLRGLSERVAALGGRIDVDSPANGGTRVSATMPLGRS